MNKEILDFVQSEPVCAIALILPDGSPHNATLHHAHALDPFCLIFETNDESRKFSAFSYGNSARASVVIGVNENDFRTLQLNGLATRIDKNDPKVAVYTDKFPKKASRIADEHIQFFIFTPVWWRYSSWTPDKRKSIISSEDAL